MSKTLAKIIGYGALVLIVVVAFGFIYKFTNGFNEDFKTFYIEYDGKQILTADSKLTLEEGETHTFIVRYTFDSDKSEPKDYSVKIIPNVERDFDYTVNGDKYIYSKTGEMTAAFNFEKGQAQFSITIPEGFDLQKALASVNSGKTVVVPTDADTNNTYPYTLVVSSYNGKVTYSIDLNTVDTSIIVKPEFASEYKISGINVNLGSGESYIEDLRGNNGTYTFTMPDTATMEIDGYITLMFYIIPIDM